VSDWQLGLFAWFGLCSLLTIGFIGKERQPMKPIDAVMQVLIYAALAYAVARA
jgi:hypothetical protein